MSPQGEESTPIEHQPTPSEPSRSELHSGRNLGRILVILVVLLVLVNIPFNDYGFGLAHLMPDTTTIIIEEGVLLQGSGPNLFILENHKLRQVISPQASRRYFQPEGSQSVENHLLEQFGSGAPIRHLVKCQDSPRIYALELERGWKRWVKDPPAVRQSKPWDRVHNVTCAYLARFSEGPPL